uniref:rRNA-processing protein EBP2 n=1 Tax=Parastrongyloides trichosuri TaxID=131310 RepID=A0A0N4ZQ43_PARTI
MSGGKINKVEELKADDFKRELVFYNQAVAGAQIAIQKLQKLNVPVFRPPDYFAEMAKTDEHMTKVQDRLTSIQKDKERHETIRRLREEKKFAVKIQKKQLVEKQKEKKKFMDAVKKHKKGMKGQLEAMLNNANKLGYAE